MHEHVFQQRCENNLFRSMRTGHSHSPDSDPPSPLFPPPASPLADRAGQSIKFPDTCWRPQHGRVSTGAHLTLLQNNNSTKKSSPLLDLMLTSSLTIQSVFAHTLNLSVFPFLYPSLSLNLFPSYNKKEKSHCVCGNQSRSDKLGRSFERASLTESISRQRDPECWRWGSLEPTLGGDRL